MVAIDSSACCCRRLCASLIDKMSITIALVRAAQLSLAHSAAIRREQTHRCVDTIRVVSRSPGFDFLVPESSCPISSLMVAMNSSACCCRWSMVPHRYPSPIDLSADHNTTLRFRGSFQRNRSAIFVQPPLQLLLSILKY
ncbi:uncharacterized protein LOC116805599 [Drosophila grimshawi]|uniref:uncharacterized protein LOC116805599 n=1 Tax=Drosophila grimshawi TaxID=7222 RepID=UPI001C935136|nr:uncharacterized protein LOC116805599 [Drosophila grimshawi]